MKAGLLPGPKPFYWLFEIQNTLFAKRNNKFGKKECSPLSQKILLSSGPFHVPDLTTISAPPQFISENERIVISLKNPTNHKLEAKVRLDICLNPTTPSTGMFPLDNLGEFVIGETTESENGIFVKVDPHSCTRIERLVDPNERRATFRVITWGDFNIINGNTAGGRLEISVLVGNHENDNTFGLDEGDASTFIPYGNWFVV
jgi:hypothetical protein